MGRGHAAAPSALLTLFALVCVPSAAAAGNAARLHKDAMVSAVTRRRSRYSLTHRPSFMADYSRVKCRGGLTGGGKALDTNLERAVFGGGCFWCVEAVFRELKGVKNVISGYAGGKDKNPTYDSICTGKTGHAEVVAIDFNPKIIQYADLLKVFWAAHDPTTLNRQGADVGTQYRSVIYTTTESQVKDAKTSLETEQVRQADQKLFGCIPMSRKVVTEIEPLQEFFSAESYHQNYYQKAPYIPYCAVNIAPKLVKIRSKFRDLLREEGYDDDDE